MSRPADPTEYERIEAHLIYRAIFKRPIPELLVARFLEASRRVLQEEGQDRALKVALDREYDLEAIEMALRYTGKIHPLRTKFKLMVYLAETLPDHQQYYVNSRNGWLRGLVAILLGGFRTSFKLVKGLLLLRIISDA